MTRPICHNAARNAPLSQADAYALVEVVIALALIGILMLSITRGYILASSRAEWSAYSLAAQSLAIQRLEQARACKWDPEATPPVDEFVAANFPLQVNILDIPYASTNYVFATNITTISTISSTPPLKQIQVQCVWAFANGRTYTNTILSYRSPDT